MTIAAFALLFDFAERLARIITSVGAGDPFTRANADRLNRMAWLAMIVQAIQVVQSIMSDRVASDAFRMDIKVTLTALSVGLILFILARVFRHGTSMRDDLEGIV